MNSWRIYTVLKMQCIVHYQLAQVAGMSSTDMLLFCRRQLRCTHILQVVFHEQHVLVVVPRIDLSMEHLLDASPKIARIIMPLKGAFYVFYISKVLIQNI